MPSVPVSDENSTAAVVEITSPSPSLHPSLNPIPNPDSTNQSAVADIEGSSVSEDTEEMLDQIVNNDDIDINEVDDEDDIIIISQPSLNSSSQNDRLALGFKVRVRG
jgi:hypothetical protein